MFRPWLQIPSKWYSAISNVRNYFYDTNIKAVTSYVHPVLIGVGNLSLGGTGKTPLILYIADFLAQIQVIALLSRGYKRISVGFQCIDSQDSPFTSGDEAYLCFQRFKNNPNATTAVCNNRVQGIHQIMLHRPGTTVVLLDDAFQHRRIKPTLNILLTTFHAPFFKDDVLPLGNLREPRKGAARADIILVTKSPKDVADGVKESFFKGIQKYHPNLERSSIFFTHILYKNPICVWSKTEGQLPHSLLLVTGIAQPWPLRDHLMDKGHSVIHLAFPDHHWFRYKDIVQIVSVFQSLNSTAKAMVTTEKDSVRFQYNHWQTLLTKFPMFYIPITVEFSKTDQLAFEEKLMDVCAM